MSEARAPVEVYDPALAEASRAGGGDDEIALIARVTDPEALPPGVRILSRLGTIVTLRATRAQLELLADCPAAVDLEAPRRLTLPSDAVDVEGPTTPSGYSRRPEGLRHTGRHRIVAGLDWGFDFASPAFRRPDGTTRFIALWDQRGSDGSGPGNRWGYGRILTRADIDRALSSADPYATLGYHPADAATSDAQTGRRAGPAHGTHVLDIAAGSARDDGMTGVAPDSDLLGVHLAHTVDVLGTGNLGNSVSVFEGLHWVFSVVGDRPCVVNMSVGAQGGSHDGMSLVEQGIDEAIRLGRQQLVVMSIGNYARTGAHWHGRLGQGERARLTISVPAADPTRSEVEIWYPGTDRFTVTVFGPDSSVLGAAGPGTVIPLRAGADEVGRVYHVRSARNGRHLIDILLAAGAPGGNWMIELAAESVPTGDGRYYSWIERESGPHPRFIPQNNDPRTSTGSLCNGRLSIGVGAYDPHTPERPIAPFSSAGPTVDGLVKPDIVAPGRRIRAARSTPRGGTPGPATVEMSGTSMAAPHVTGLVAVMLEAAGEKLDVFDIRATLLATADRPELGEHHGDLHQFGAGYLDPVAAERAVTDANQDNQPADRPSEVAMTTPFDQLPSEEAPMEASPLAALPTPASLPLVLAGPMVRRAQPDAVWFWIACSQKITNCTPQITVYNLDGSRNAELTERMKLAPATPQVARLGERLWVAIVAARPVNLTFGVDWIYGYDLAIEAGTATTSVRLTLPDIAYRPFDRPTFRLRSSTRPRIVHGSCRRPGGWGSDASFVFDKWVEGEVKAGARGNRPSALFLTGDQIYADDVAYPLFQAARRLAADLFVYDEQLPLPDGTGSMSVAQLTVKDWRGLSGLDTWLASARARLTRRLPRHSDFNIFELPKAMDVFGRVARAGSPGEPSRSPALPLIADRDMPGRIGFSTEDGQGHLLSFAEFAAMYLLVWNAELWNRYVREEAGSGDSGTDNLTGFASAVAAARRLLANMPTYMLFDDHEVTDDWNLDGDWKNATSNPMARRVISNGLAAYWAFQAWGNDPGQFDTAFVSAITQHLSELSASNGRPGAGARAFDAALHGRYWAYAAPTQPPVLCVDTRTQRQFLANGRTVLSGPYIHPQLRQLLTGGGFRRGEPLTIVLPSPFLAHRSMLYVQGKYEYKWPRDRYAGDFELYANNSDQRPDLLWFLRSVLDPPALVVLSGDVHHGFVIDGLYAGARTLDEIYRGKATWAMRVIQITSSAIKNIKKDAFVDDKAVITDAGKLGELLIPQYENQYKTMPDGTKIAQRAAATRLKGDLGRKTYVFENHLCVVDFGSNMVDVLFIGDARDSKAAFASGQRHSLLSTLWTATTTVGLANDPASFTPPAHWLLQQAGERPFAGFKV
jgi:subtilisin family serine protease